MFVPFEHTGEIQTTLDDTSLISALTDAGDAVAIFISMGQHFKDYNRAEVDCNISKTLAERDCRVNLCVQRIPIQFYFYLYIEGKF